MPTSAGTVPSTLATAAYSGLALNGQAVKDACDRTKNHLSRVAPRMLDLYALKELVWHSKALRP